MEGTKKQLVDYVYANFKFKDNTTKKKLETYSSEKLESIIVKFKKESDYEQYLKELKYPKYFVNAEIDGKSMSYDNLKAKNEKEAEELIKEDNPNSKIVIEKILNTKGHHRCKYCYEIVEGTNRDYLCENCHETFGHHLYSEL